MAGGEGECDQPVGDQRLDLRPQRGEVDDVVERHRGDAVRAGGIDQCGTAGFEGELRKAPLPVDADQRGFRARQDGHGIGRDHAARHAVRRDQQAVEAVAATAVAFARDHGFGDRDDIRFAQPHAAQRRAGIGAHCVERHRDHLAHATAPGLAVNRRMPKIGPAVLPSCGTTRTVICALPRVSGSGIG